MVEQIYYPLSTFPREGYEEFPIKLQRKGYEVINERYKDKKLLLIRVIKNSSQYYIIPGILNGETEIRKQKVLKIEKIEEKHKKSLEIVLNDMLNNSEIMIDDEVLLPAEINFW